LSEFACGFFAHCSSILVAARPFSSPGQDDRYSALRDSVTGLSRRASCYQSGLSRIAHERVSDPTVTPANRRLRLDFSNSATTPCAIISGGLSQGILA
jgi:hypothetical protein